MNKIHQTDVDIEIEKEMENNTVQNSKINEPILTQNPKRFVLFPIKYPEI